MNAVRGEASVVVGGQEVVLRPTFTALVSAEGERGPLFALVERAARGGLTLGELAGLMWHCAVGFEGFARCSRRGWSRADWRRRRRRCACCWGRSWVDASFAQAAAGAARFGQLLGWSPEMFWAATPADLRLALGEPEAGADGAEMARLMEAFPDG